MAAAARRVGCGSGRPGALMHHHPCRPLRHLTTLHCTGTAGLPGPGPDPGHRAQPPAGQPAARGALRALCPAHALQCTATARRLPVVLAGGGSRSLSGGGAGPAGRRNGAHRSPSASPCRCTAGRQAHRLPGRLPLRHHAGAAVPRNCGARARQVGGGARGTPRPSARRLADRLAACLPVCLPVQLPLAHTAQARRAAAPAALHAALRRAQRVALPCSSPPAATSRPAPTPAGSRVSTEPRAVPAVPAEVLRV